MRWMAPLPEMIDWLLNCPYTGAWWENELKALGKWLEWLQLLPTETGFCSACSSMNARLDAAMFGEGLVLVTSGDISCFKQSGRDCRGSEVVTAGVQRGWGWVEMKTNGEHEWNYKLGSKKSEWNVKNKQRVSGFRTLSQHAEGFKGQVLDDGSKGII